jgi:hypothetical protein
MKKLLFTILFILSFTLASYAEGQLEIGMHYSTWGSSYFGVDTENNIADAFESYNGSLEFDPHGHNYGIQIRFFPGGEYGSFSLGISYERNYFNADISGSYSENGNTITGEGDIELAPHSFTLDFRWDIIPRSRIHPYVGFGFGAGPLHGTARLTTVTRNDSTGAVTTQTETVTLREAIKNIEENNDVNLSFIDAFPIVYIDFGLRAEIIDSIYLLGEIAFYDGFIARGGVSFRF